MDKWNAYDFSSCNVSQFKPEEGNPGYANYERGGRSYSFNVYVSDKIGPYRALPVMRHPKCANVTYPSTSTKASIVIIYHNEAFSVLVRMINGILKLTPEALLREIILYDDYSEKDLSIEEALRKYAKLAGWNSDKIKFYRTEQREGLIRAKVLASRLATAEVLIFLDSHCEVTQGWLEPLIHAVDEDPNRAVLPIVDLINPVSFEYAKAMVAKGGFDWGLNFKWEYFDWSYFDVLENNVKLFESPAMSGGLLAMKTETFRRMGEYDMGMEIWGAENIELSIRMWLCGGSVVVAPCSRVGHVFRTRRPYVGKPGVDTSVYNALRTVKVWFDDYEKYFFQARRRAEQMETGDLSERMELRKKLNCKPFRWFIENVYSGLRPPREEL
ncbi:GLY-8 protein [Aphelenchoides avenae]|nr:GLY-8 protein [Aphelenchus avenae]